MRPGFNAMTRFAIFGLAVLSAALGTHHPAAARSAAQAAQAAGPSVVLVVARSAGVVRSGSGFIIASDTFHSTVVTAYHVVAGAGDVTVVLEDNINEQYHAQVAHPDALRDAAILTIRTGGRKTLPVVADAATPLGTDVEVTGYPGQVAIEWSEVAGQHTIARRSDVSRTLRTGKVVGFRPIEDRIFFDAPINHGDSGAPIIDVANGAVVGMTEGNLIEARGLDKVLSGSNRGLAISGLSSTIRKWHLQKRAS